MAAPAEQYHHPPLPTSPPEPHQLHRQHYQQQQLQSPPQHPYQHQQTRQQPPRTPAHGKHRSLSFHSERSHKSSGSKDLHESHAEKEARRLHTKADPTLAMNEAEPSTIAAMKTEPLSAPLRSIQHKDNFGNVIAEPDKSNPTRHRWERPLDTIRSFEAAIDGGYARKSIYRADTDSSAQLNRRSSYHPGHQPRFPHDSYYGGRPASLRPESTYYGPTNPGTARNSFYEGQGNSNGHHNNHGPQAGRQRASRMHSEPHYSHHGRENVYPLPHKDRSYETVTSAAGSGNSEPAGYQTDPTSSDNSSIDRPSPDKRPEPVNDYGIGFNQQQSYQTPSFSVGLPSNGKHPLPSIPAGSVPQHTSAIPQKKVSVLRRQPSQQASETSEKRKSWFSRRFSKN